MKEALMNMLKQIDWRPIVYKLMMDTVVPELEKHVLKTTNKWDDYSVGAVKFLVEKFLGDEEKEEEAKKVLLEKPE